MEKKIKIITKKNKPIAQEIPNELKLSDITSIADLIFQLITFNNGGNKLEREFKTELDTIIEKLNTNNYTLKEENKQSSLIFKDIINSKSFEEMNENICKLIDNFYLELKRKNNKTIQLCLYFKELKKDNKIKPILYRRDQTIDELLKSVPQMSIHHYVSLFDYHQLIVDKRKGLVDFINTRSEQKEKITTILKYIDLGITAFTETNKTELKEEFLNGIKTSVIINNYKNDSKYENYMIQVNEFLNLFPTSTEDITKFFIAKEKTKLISKILVKDNLDKYLTPQTLKDIVFKEEMRTFTYYENQFNEWNTRLIHIYDLFKEKDDTFIIKISNIAKKNSDQKCANIILSRQYTEDLDDYYFSTAKFDKKYMKLPKDIVIKLVTEEDKESINFLDNFKDAIYIGIDSEWKPSLSVFEKKEHSSDIIQIACEKYVAILDTKSFVNNADMMNKFTETFKDKIFIGFSFSSDIREMDKCFKDFFLELNKKKKIIEITDLYINKYGDKCPDLSATCEQILGKPLNKIDRMSNWQNRPLHRKQTIYCALDAFVLLNLYKQLK